MSSTIETTQRIVGVYGYIRSSYGTLRSIGLIVANGTAPVTEDDPAEDPASVDDEN